MTRRTHCATTITIHLNMVKFRSYSVPPHEREQIEDGEVSSPVDSSDRPIYLASS